ncbi:MAG: 3-hydroxybutyryl-CoA dehydrogenase [Oligoflexia bacterium]|nr:3-hydroxybutyryl-CoA dehydrogenase [Oligoflexia bacterium]
MGQIVGVLGAGQMGSGIAQVLAGTGHDVILFDLYPEALSRAINTISSSCDRLIKKEALTLAQKDELLKRIKTSDDFSALKPCDIAIEAVTEKESLKLEIFKNLDATVKPGAILASNTSSISITKIGSVTKRPDKVVGMHFMNPVPVMKLVEGIRGLATSDETFAVTKSLAEKMGKTFVEARDFPGFIVNRILMPMINEAVYTFFEGVAEPLAIDNAMKLGTNQPMGPLALADFIGLDTCLAIMNVLHDGLGDSKYRACPLLIKYVEAGWLGKKTGRGFYKYEGAK